LRDDLDRLRRDYEENNPDKKQEKDQKKRWQNRFRSLQQEQVGE